MATTSDFIDEFGIVCFLLDEIPEDVLVVEDEHIDDVCRTLRNVHIITTTIQNIGCDDDGEVI